MIPLAVTGGIAEGKSTVMGYLRENGVRCESADDIAREVWEDEELHRQLDARLGAPHTSDRASLLRAMAANHSLRRAVNSIFHPMVLARMVSCGAQAIEVPLLIETCTQGLFDRVWVVTCGQEEQRRRLIARHGECQMVENLLTSQLPTEVKIAFADQIVRTNRSPFDVQSQVVSLARALGLA